MRLSALALSLAIHAAASAIVLDLGHGRDPEAPEADPSPALAGQTFEIPELEPERADERAAADGVDSREGVAGGNGASPSSASASAATRAHAKSNAPSAAGGVSAGGASAKDGAHAEASTPSLYGAVGERGVADLATAFTRAFPQAASADPSWTRASFGSAGTADVSLEIDAAGRLIASHIAGTPIAALREGIARTLVLLRERSFVSAGAITRLHIVATISPDAVHDGLHGDVFAIGGSFSGREGSAFFALSIGRRIDLTITRK